MKKSEKIIVLCFILSMILMLGSSIYTIIKLKPSGYTFNIEKLFQ